MKSKSQFKRIFQPIAGRVYTIPTVHGLWYGVTTSLIIILGLLVPSVNGFYIGISLAFIGVLSLIVAANNIKRLEILSDNEHVIRQDRSRDIPFTLKRGINSPNVFAIETLFEGNDPQKWPGIVRFCKAETQRIEIEAELPSGLYVFSRVRIQSYFPFSLVKSLMYLEGEWNIYVYPNSNNHLNIDFPLVNSSQGRGDQEIHNRNYREGDSFHRVDWRPFLRGGNPQTRLLAEGHPECVYIDWEAIPLENPYKGEQLSYWLETYLNSGIPFVINVTDKEKIVWDGRSVSEQSIRKKTFKWLAVFQGEL